MIPVALWNNGSYTIWSGPGDPSEPWQRANTIEDFPKRSSRIRPTGVLVPNIAAGVVTADAESSSVTCIKSLGSRTRKVSVSDMFFPSELKEYCTVEN